MFPIKNLNSKLQQFLLKIPPVKNIYNRGYLKGFREGLYKQREHEARLFFEQTKDMFSGQRGFVIGNGPSLTIEDLDKLKGEITIAANKIFLAFDKTEWRPTYVSVCDELLWPKIAGEVHHHYDEILMPALLDSTLCKTRCLHYSYLGNTQQAGIGNSNLPFSSDFTTGAFGGFTITYDNIQFAAHLGLNPIYLIGCDHYYHGENEAVMGKPIAALSNNHFLKNYRTDSELVNPAPIELMTKSYEVAKAYCQRTNIEIYNATRGGHLEVFTRVSFQELMK